MKKLEIVSSHPRATSLRTREKLTSYLKDGIVARAGLIAHGRGEAFDYLLGEKTTAPALKAINAAAATILLANDPVISVNGNVAALVAKEVVALSNLTSLKIEVNLFHRSLNRELAIRQLLKTFGAKKVLGVGKSASEQIREVSSQRQDVDPRGIAESDVVLIPLEDGDRTERLRAMNKIVIAFDLNPLSRTAQYASITIVDNVIRALPALIEEVRRLKKKDPKELQQIVFNFDNQKILAETITLINQRLSKIAEKGTYLPDLKCKTKLRFGDKKLEGEMIEK